jgi:Fur family transcriptional regulator, zinc uptake regulator
MFSEEKMSNNRVLMPFKEHGHKHQHCLETALLAAEKTCLERGVRLTSIRRRVLELIWSSHEPVKAYDILDQLRNEHASSAPPTVYRALDFLQAEGLVHKIESLNAYVGCAEPDHSYQTQFLICHDCGSVAELDNVNVRQLLAENAKQMGFHIDHETIEIKGTCAACVTEHQ